MSWKDELQATIRTIEELKSVPSRASKEAAAKISELLQDQFEHGLDPYGKPWMPLEPSTIRRKGGNEQILVRSGALQQKTVAKASKGSGIEVTSLAYGSFHQTGTRKMVARPILPSEGLPDSWTEAIENSADNAFAGKR